MSQDTWDEYFFQIREVVESKSKDRATKCGCVIIGSGNEIVSTGYNGMPRGVNDDADERHERPAKYLWTEHAERNAIYNACRLGVSLSGCKLYLGWYPCSRCARAIIQAGIVEIVLDGRKAKENEEYWKQRWSDDIAVSMEMIKESGVNIRVWRDNRIVE